jgi:transposase-like protein
MTHGGVISTSEQNPSGPIVATVTVHTGEGRRSHFDCPNCGKTIRYTNAYPLSFQWKVCPGCRLQWIPVELLTAGIGPHADDIAGQTNLLRLASSGRPV